MEEIISVIRGKLRKGCPVDIKEYSIDSRSVITPERTLFFALKGKNHDGHNYISDLYEEGVRAFVISDWLPEFDRLKEANFITVIN
ncbi:MAG: Mur ligase domain-containing protein, partial [Marinifilaceae bacterium]|nr:Mur ligase domain-containing protein [Marinifilaceae bacterium]